MWLLSWLPDWIFHLITFLGLLGIVASIILDYIPFIGKYKLPLQIVAVLLLTLGVFFQGSIYNEKVWLDRIAELEKKVAIAEEKSKQENVRIETKVVERIKVVKQNVDVIRKEIQVKKELINQGCELSDTAIEMYNKAVQNE